MQITTSIRLILINSLLEMQIRIAATYLTLNSYLEVDAHAHADCAHQGFSYSQINTTYKIAGRVHSLTRTKLWGLRGRTGESALAEHVCDYF